MKSPKLDEIGYWSEIKLDIIREYAQAYSKILSAQRSLTHIYIDGFAGSGVHVSKTSGKFVSGSPLNALYVQPPFNEYHLIDVDSSKAAALRQITAGRSDVTVYQGDCNEVLMQQVLPRAKYENFRRALCVLDPYGIHLDWRVVETAGQLRTVDMFLNLSIMDMNMNVLRRDSGNIDPNQAQRMTAIWGDDSWRQVAWSVEQDLFGGVERKQENEVIVSAYANRLKKHAGFKHVEKPLPMRNSKGAVVYYLFFASHKPVAVDIVQDIFKKYENFGVS